MSDWVFYLLELRRRVIFCLLVVFGLFIIFFIQSQWLFHFIALPILHHLLPNAHLIAIELTAPLFVPLKLSFISAIFLSMPFLFWQLWRFIAPALLNSERRILLPLFSGSIILFYLGAIFAYFIFLPLIFHILVTMAPAEVQVMPDMGYYLSFVSQFIFTFGLVFQTPLIIIFLLRANICSYEAMVRKRPYVIVSAFVVGMLFTPPDVISQILLAIPIWLLYELGLLCAKLFKLTHIKKLRN